MERPHQSSIGAAEVALAIASTSASWSALASIGRRPISVTTAVADRRSVVHTLGRWSLIVDDRRIRLPAELHGCVTTQELVVGLDNGGTTNNVTVLELATGKFLIDGLFELPSEVRLGPDVAIDALVRAFTAAVDHVRGSADQVVAVGLDSPGPASANGVISSRGSTNFVHPGWRGFDIRRGLEMRLDVPVVYNNDGNAAALYAHHTLYGADANEHDSVCVVIGTGLGGG